MPENRVQNDPDNWGVAEYLAEAARFLAYAEQEGDPDVKQSHLNVALAMLKRALEMLESS